MSTLPHLPLVDLRRVHAPLADELAAAFARVLASGQYHLGPETEALEAEFTRHEGGAHGVCCGSGSDALVLALRALDFGPGDAVVTVANSFVATPESIARTGARVVFCDVDPKTRCLDPLDLARILDEPGADAIRAVIPVHLYGVPADLAGLREVLDEAGRTDVSIIGDAAQAHGAPGIGAVADLTCYSFYPAKNLGALGDGGFVIARNSRHAHRVRSLRNHGRAGKHSVGEVGLNSRFDEVQAATLRIKLPHLHAANAARRELAASYRRRLAAHEGTVRLPAALPGDVVHLFVIELTTGQGSDVRDRVFNALRDDFGIGAGLHYPVPCHRMPPYPTERALPVTEALCDRVLSLPLFPGMTEDEVDRVASALEATLGLRAPGTSRRASAGATR